MKLTVMDGFDTGSSLENALKKILEVRHEEFLYFKLREMNILPCRSCEVCTFKTPGQCVAKDDISKIIASIAKSDAIIFLTPIRFGGYSSQLKKAVDKTALAGLPLYMVKDGHLLHPMRYGSKALIAIGLNESEIGGAEENFKTLLSRNALNMQCYYSKALVFKKADDLRKIENEVNSALEAALGGLI